MANTVRTNIILDGPSHVTLQVFLQSDGASGDLTNVVLLSPDDVSPQLPNRQDFTIKQIWYELAGFSATLAFNATTPWPFWTLDAGNNVQHDWRFFGGITDRSGGTFGLNATGELLISTEGFTSASDSGAIVLWIEKRDRPNPQPQ